MDLRDRTASDAVAFEITGAKRNGDLPFSLTKEKSNGRGYARNRTRWPSREGRTARGGGTEWAG